MKAKEEVIPTVPIHQRSWFMWLWLIIFPPAGIAFLWLQNKLGTLKKIVLTILVSIYFFILPTILLIVVFIIWNPSIPVWSSPIPLYHSHEEFTEAFNQEVLEHDLPYSIHTVKEENSIISSELGQNITLLENMDKDGNVQELILIGQGAGTDIVLIMGTLIGIADTELEEQEIGQVLKELRLFDENYQFDNEVTVERNLIRYNLKYDQSAGVIFSISNVN